MAKAKIAKKEGERLKEELQKEEDIPAPPDGGYGWVIVIASFVCNMVVDGIGNSFGILLPAFMTYFDAPKGTVAWVGSILAGTVLGVGPIVSAVANKFGCRVTCITGCVIASVSLALSSYCPNVTVLMLVYGFFGGIGLGFMYLPAVVMVGYYFESKRSLATGISVCGTGVGTFAFAPLIAMLLQYYGWRTSVLVLAGMAIACIPFGLLMKPLTYEEKVITHSIPSVYNSNLSVSKRENVQPLARKDVFYASSIQNLKEFQSRASLHDYRHSVHSIQKPNKPKNSCSDICGELVDFSLLKDPVFMVIAVSNLFGMTGFYIPFVYVVELAKSEGIEDSQAAMLISVIGIVNTVARIGIGVIADMPKVNNFHVNNLCLIVAAITTALFPLCHSYMTFVVVSVFFGVAVAGYISLTSIILVEFLGLEKLTNAFGLTILFRGVASVVGSPLAGTLYDTTKTYTIPFAFGGAMFAISAVISMAAVCFKKKDKNEELDLEQSAPINREQKSTTGV